MSDITRLTFYSIATGFFAGLIVGALAMAVVLS